LPCLQSIIEARDFFTSLLQGEILKKLPLFRRFPQIKIRNLYLLTYLHYYIFCVRERDRSSSSMNYIKVEQNRLCMLCQVQKKKKKTTSRHDKNMTFCAPNTTMHVQIITKCVRERKKKTRKICIWFVLTESSLVKWNSRELQLPKLFTFFVLLLIIYIPRMVTIFDLVLLRDGVINLEINWYVISCANRTKKNEKQLNRAMLY